MSLLKRLAPAPRPEILVIIGAHRDERAFGERVVAGLDPARFAVLRIEQGIRGDRPTPEGRAAFRDRHHALYLQVLDHVTRGHRLLIDLHAGLDERGPRADVLCAEAKLLTCLASGTIQDEAASAGKVRGVRLVASTNLTVLAPETEAWPVARPEIPEAVWNRDDPRYVGVEVYLRRPGDGAPEEWRLAQALIRRIAGCVLRFPSTGSTYDQASQRSLLK